MRAAVLFEQGKPQRVEELDLEAPRRGEVLVRMAASGVCHSCLHAADGSWKGVPLPIVLGDEGAGVVEALGPDVAELTVGDHVILSWAPTCGRCHYCVIGRPNLCERRQPGRGVLPDGTTRMSLGGAPVYHYGHVATYASRTVVHESCAIRIDPAMPLDRAALIGCSVMTGVGAVLNTAAVPAGAGMAVFGVGGVGLNVVQGGALVAAHPIIAVDLLPAKLEHARAVGATHLIDASREDPVAAIRAITGRGADFTFVAVGATRPIAQAVEALAPGGTCVLIGVPESGAMVPLDVRPMVTGERVVRGSSYGSARTREDLPRMVALYRAGRLRIDELITHRYGLEDANEAFRALAAGELGRGIIVF
ncbi:MAG TPA: zinc-binding dehydrogenase [Methylomirabilota bacterium]|jgi:Zn-dependent alcohol dehydrogenase|nr:zinc-binding dehydrogenase [Methylomirabilota bacterium]